MPCAWRVDFDQFGAFGLRALGGQAQRLQEEAQRMHGLAQVVAGGSEEARFGAVGGVNAPLLDLQVLGQFGILEAPAGRF